MKLLATLDKTAAFDLGERRNNPLLIAGAASEDAKLQCLKGLLSSLAANRSTDEAMMYAFGDDAGRLRQLPPLPLMQPVCPPLVQRWAEKRDGGLPRIENPCTDGELACRMIGTMLRLEMELRLRLFAAAGTRDLERYNAKATDRPLPYIVIAVDGADESLDFPKSEFFGCMERVLALGGARGRHGFDCRAHSRAETPLMCRTRPSPRYGIIRTDGTENHLLQRTRQGERNDGKWATMRRSRRTRQHGRRS